MSRLVLIHDWLTTYAGAERVLEQMLMLCPKAALWESCMIFSSRVTFAFCKK
jgi:hypothetical protein